MIRYTDDRRLPADEGFSLHQKVGLWLREPHGSKVRRLETCQNGYVVMALIDGFQVARSNILFNGRRVVVDLMIEHLERKYYLIRGDEEDLALLALL